jgi:hypothetical protein
MAAGGWEEWRTEIGVRKIDLFFKLNTNSQRTPIFLCKSNF